MRRAHSLKRSFKRKRTTKPTMTSVDAWLVQVLLPLRDNRGRTFPQATWDGLKRRLVDAFGGVTAYQRAPAEGVWAPEAQKQAAEDVFVVEVMTEAFDARWWEALQQDLERTLQQEQVVVRAIRIAEVNPVRARR